MASHTDTIPAAGSRAEAAAMHARRSAKPERSNPLMGLSHVALVLWSLLVIIPIVWTFLAAFKTNTEIFGDPWTLPHHWGIDSWTRAWSKANIGRYMLNTVFIVAVSTFGTMLLGSMAAYVLARFPFRGNRFIYMMFVSGMTFPVFLALVPLFFVVKNLGMLNTYQGLILVYIAYSLPFTVFFMAAFFRTLPTSVAEAAAIDGCSHTRTFFRIMLPMAKPGLISIAIFNVIGQWNQYLLPIVLLSGAPDKQVITQGVTNISTSAGADADWPGMFAALSMAIIPVIIVYIIFQRQIQSGLTAGAVK
jgi:N-acetylglucosamine transport system permease protein